MNVVDLKDLEYRPRQSGGYLPEICYYRNTPFTDVGRYIHTTEPGKGNVNYFYYKNGVEHNEDGPSSCLVRADGSVVQDSLYYLDGKYYTKEHWKEELERRGIKKSPEYFKNLL